MQAPTLTLHVTHLDGQPPAAPLCKVFDSRGGTLGRAAQNDWALPDPQRVLSSHHATLYFEAGHYHLVDCSSNGVYLNDDEQPLGLERIAPLAEGDRLQVGPYTLLVALGDSTGTAAAVPASLPAATVTPAWPASGPLPSDTPLGGEVLDPLALLAPAAPTVPAALPAATARDDTPVLRGAFQPPNALPEDWLDPLTAATPGASVQAAVNAPSTPALQQALAEARSALQQLQAALQRIESTLCAPQPAEEPIHERA